VAYLWRPAFAHVLDRMPHDVSCYHIDDEYSFSDRDLPLDPAEARLISRVDEVFIHSPALLEKKGHLNPHTTVVPNGVDFAAFATPAAEPADLALVPRPRIGYVGRIKRQLDLRLVRTLAVRHPRWSFVMVGPVEHVAEIGPAIAELTRLPNVHFLGPKLVAELPAYTQHLDVCALWYEVNGYTKFIYPLKLHEYLATGCPVVGTPIDSLRAFDGVARLARTADEWSQALTHSLSEAARSPGAAERRQGVARAHDWSRIVSTIATAMARHLGEAYPERLDAGHSAVQAST
jgi:glycosyltransferase involved in cell wall biosynthesis